MFKRLTVIFVTILMALSLVACYNDKNTEPDNVQDETSNVSDNANVGNYESDVLSNKTFVKMFEESYKYVDKEYNPSETYLTDVDGKIKDYYKGYDGDYFLTDDGLYCSMWGGPHYTSEIDIDIGDNSKIVYVGFSIIILADYDGKCDAWEVERKEPDYNPYKYHKLTVPDGISDTKMSEAGMTSLYAYLFKGVDVNGINTVRVSEDYNGGLEINDFTFSFRNPLESAPVDYILPETGRGVDGILVFGDGTAKKVDITEDESYNEYAATPYKDIENVNEIFPALGATTWCVSKNGENDMLYIYVFNNIMAYDMYEYAFDDLPFNVNDIVKCFSPEGHTNEIYVLLKNNDIYRLEIEVECYDTNHDHSSIDAYRKEHTTVNRVVYTKDGVMDGMFKPVVTKLENLHGIIKEWNVIKTYVVDSAICFILDDGKNYIYIGE